jgi:hypothetical protein
MNLTLIRERARWRSTDGSVGSWHQDRRVWFKMGAKREDS